MSKEANPSTHKFMQKIFEEATASLGSTFHTIISFHLKKKFGKDPYEILIEDPKRFYGGLEEVLGQGAKAVINLVGTYAIAKYNVSFTPEEFEGLFIEGGTSSTQKLSYILGCMAAREEKKASVTR